MKLKVKWHQYVIDVQEITNIDGDDIVIPVSKKYLRMNIRLADCIILDKPKKKNKKQHMGSHSSRMHSAFKMFPVEDLRRYRSEPVFKDGKLVVEGGKIKTKRSKMKKGMKVIKGIFNAKRRMYLKNDLRKRKDDE